MGLSRTEHKPQEAGDPLRLDRCPDCGYLLTGLPEQGICPECGFAYRADMIVLYGWAVGWMTANASNTRGKRLVWCLLVGDICFLGQMVIALMNGSLWQFAFLFGCLVATNAFLLLKRRRVLEDAPRPVQLRLFVEGISQRTGAGKVRLVPWSEMKWLAVNWCGGDRYQIEGEDGRTGWWGPNPGTVRADVDLGTQALDRVLRRLAECFPRLGIYDIRDQARVRRMQELEKQYGVGQAAGA